MSANKRYSKGITLLEVMIVTVIMSVVSYLFYEVVMQTTSATHYALAFNLMATSCQKAANQLKEDLTTSKEVFGYRFDPGSDPPAVSDTYAPNIRAVGYRLELKLPDEVPPIGVEVKPREGTGILPVLDPNGMFGPDDGTVQRTGNCLLFVKTEPAFSTRTRYGPEVGGDPEANTRIVMVDVYRIVYYYLTKVEGGNVGSVEDSLDLVRWESIRFVDKLQVESLAERDNDANDPVMQSEFIRHLVEDEGINYCWDTTGNASAGFYELVEGAASGDYSIDTSPVSAFDSSSTDLNIPMSKYEHVILNLNAKHGTISWNTVGNLFGTGAPRGAFASPIMVPRFGYPSDTGEGFPHGFEVQVIGPSGARQVLVRLVLAKETMQQRIAAHETVTIVSTRDF